MEKIDRALFFAEQYYSTFALGGWAHAALCSERQAERAQRSWAALDMAATDKAAVAANLHAFGMRGAQTCRILTRPLELMLDLSVGTGRFRGLPERGALDAEPLSHVRATINHPLDTGLLGLLSAFFMGKHALIAGGAGCVLGGVWGVAAYLPLGYRRGQIFGDFVQNSVRRCAIGAGCVGAVVGSCLIMAPHNLLLMQLTRLATAVPKLLANIVGYGVGTGVGLGYVAAVRLSAAVTSAISCTPSPNAAH
jgi:hypothetical protein